MPASGRKKFRRVQVSQKSQILKEVSNMYARNCRKSRK